MTLQKRVDPHSQLHAVSARGTFMGNRGRLHNADLRFHSNGMPARHDVMRLAEELIHLSGWQPGQPLELLPVLREQYPGGIRDEILSVCLLIHERTWFVRIIETDDDGLRGRDIDLFPLVDDGDNYDYSDCPPHEPQYVIDGLLTSTDRVETARLLDIFTPSMLGFFERFDRRVRQAAELAQIDGSAQVDFLLGCTSFLAEPLADQVSLSDLAIAKLKELPSPVSDYASYWEMLVAQWRDGEHLFVETFRADIRNVTAEVFHALPDAQQLALWISERGTADCLRELVRSGETPPDVSHLKLHDVGLLFDAAEPSILNEVDEDCYRRRIDVSSDEAAQGDLWASV